MKIHVEMPDGTAHEVEAREGWSLMEIIRDNGDLPIKAECGGCCSCATCHVYIETGADHLTAMDDDEESMLDEAFEVEDNSRLSCQVMFTKEMDGMKVKLAQNAFDG